MSSFQLAISTYFREKRNKATGIGTAVAGIGNFHHFSIIFHEGWLMSTTLFEKDRLSSLQW